MKAILYLRFSDTKQIGGTSFETQEEVCKNACLAESFDIVHTVRNEAVSASKTNTQRVAELLNFCKEWQGKFDVLVVYKLDRFARSSEQHHWLRGQLLKMGIVLRSATEKIDESPSGKLVEGVLAAVNEYDNEVKRERVKLAMWARVDQGLYPWDPPIGYKPQKIDGVKLSPRVIDKGCSDVIKSIFVKYSTGLVSVADLSREYSKRVIRNYKGKVYKFSAQNIYTIINNPFYCGMLKNKEGKIIKGQHKGIITPTLFQKCLRVKADLSKSVNVKRMYNNPDFPLRRFILCSHCKVSFTACWSRSAYGNKHAYYYCKNKKCDKYGKMIKKKDIEGEFFDYLKQVKPSRELMENFKPRFLKRYEDRKTEIKGDYISQLEIIKKLEAEEAWLIEKGKKGIIPDHLLKDQVDDLENKITLAKMDLTNIHNEEMDVTALLAYAETFIRTLEVSWLDAPLDIKNRLQRAIFPNGVSYEFPNYSNDGISPVFEIINAFASENIENVSRRGFEPLTVTLRGYCSTIELPALLM